MMHSHLPMLFNPQHEISSVLILVVMDDALALSDGRHCTQILFVLILVVMDDALALVCLVSII